MVLSASGILVAVGLSSGLLGSATATDVVSLRALAHAVDVPMLSALVIGLREGMPADVAHALEPAVGVIGGLVVAAKLVHPTRARASVRTWWCVTAQRTVIAFAVLRAG
jgi:hypothetical protein